MSPGPGITVQTLVNGAVSDHVHVADRGLSYGDGVFRTVRIDGAAPRWWPEQLAKLDSDCRRLGVTCPTRETWEQDFAGLEWPPSGIMRLTVTRGVGPRGYPPPADVAPTRVVTVWPRDHSPRQGPGLTVRVCQLRLGHQPALAGVKHLNRLENVLARAEWQSPDIHEGILLDQAGKVVSGVMSNLFIWHEGRLKTPSLDRCGVAGVARGRLMVVAAQARYAVEEADLTLGDVYAADELMFTNSLMLLERAHRLENRVWERPGISAELGSLLGA